MCIQRRVCVCVCVRVCVCAHVQGMFSDLLCRSTLDTQLTLSLFAVVFGASGTLASSPPALSPWQTHYRPQ